MARTALITGASGGIGYELAKLMANDLNLILVARSENKLEEVKAELSSHTNVTIIPFDLAKPQAAKALYDRVQQDGHRVDILVNNAGFGIEDLFLETDLDRLNQMLQLNMVALTNLTYYFGQDMVRSQYGRILNIGSIASFVPTPAMSAYAATKAYVLSLSESLNTELQKKGNLSVTALCPGPTATNFANEANMQSMGESFNDIAMSPERVASIGYHALFKKKNVSIPGKRYKFLIAFTRILTRKMVQRLLAKSLK
ncbi:SDR family NAD(P)-dependent oxidoreductase [Alkalibacillus salilacus]|uniref:Short-subunit dehydrogenase n=1 Tax=Alkalibacillus salilacus TaxID=284582 RepID=A0ABT9VGC8_9BACI|nr:SDR family oxidoreductase [Alkalibacillus salilacus]MDQ0160001.1 short-subunit dehydrogenase [Alkalibacillus salilacus]